jgi:ATPase family associated with various cellular activities (AAA)
MPADIVGTRIWRPSTESFDIELGPIFGNLILADEINRAPANVQSALLEAMAEHQVSIGGTSFGLPQPFLVLATQNPIETDGIYHPPEAQRDRFLLKIDLSQPNELEEMAILARMGARPPRTGSGQHRHRIRRGDRPCRCGRAPDHRQRLNRAGGYTKSALFDPDLETVGLSSDELEIGSIESADPDDSVPIADVAVVQDDVVGRCVVADVSDVWVVAFGDALCCEGSGQFGDLLDAVEVAEGQGQGQLVGEILRGRVVCELRGDPAVVDGDADCCHVGLLGGRLIRRVLLWLSARRAGR